MNSETLNFSTAGNNVHARYINMSDIYLLHELFVK